MANAKRDENYVPTLIAVSNADGVTPVVLYADPTTHRLLVSAVPGALDNLTDVVITAGAQGDVLYFNGTDWVNLPPGANGQFLKTQGAGANPVWAAATAGAAGSDTQVQFNDGGVNLGADAGLTYNKTTDVLTAAGGFVSQMLTVTPLSDLPAGTFRRNSSAQTNYILQIQTEANAHLAGFDKLGNLGATNFSGSSSGSNTGDQTITLSGAVTGTGTGAITVTMNSVLDDLTDVLISAPTVDDVLKFNGASWVNGPAAVVSAGGGVNYYMDDTSIIGTGVNNAFPIKTLSPAPIASAEDADTIVCSAATGDVLYGAYLYDTALGRTSLDAGAWTFDTYASADSATGVSQLALNVFRVRAGTGTVTITGVGTSRTATASTGTPFAVADIDASATNSDASYLVTPLGLYQITARTSDTVVTISVPVTYTNETTVAYTVWKKLLQIVTAEINNITPAYSLFTATAVQTAFTVATTDKLAEMVFGRTTSAGSRTITFVHNGTQHYSHFHAPFISMHNSLAGLNGGSAGEYYHLTLAEYTGTGTGNFVRATSPQISAIELGHATDTTITRVSAGVIAVEGVTVDTISAANALSNKTLTAPKFANAGFIADANGNEQIIFTTTTSAVNEFTIINAATGNAPQLSVTGGDGNIDLKLVPKGTGIVKGERKIWQVRLVDSATALATGDAKGGDYRISPLRAITIKAVGAYVDVVSSSGTPTVDINEAGTTILSTKITIDANEKTSTTAATAAVISDSAVAADAIITFDVDVAGTGTKGLVVWMEYEWA